MLRARLPRLRLARGSAKQELLGANAPFGSSTLLPAGRSFGGLRAGSVTARLANWRCGVVDRFGEQALGGERGTDITTVQIRGDCELRPHAAQRP